MRSHWLIFSKGGGLFKLTFFQKTSFHKTFFFSSLLKFTHDFINTFNIKYATLKFTFFHTLYIFFSDTFHFFFISQILFFPSLLLFHCTFKLTGCKNFQNFYHFSNTFQLIIKIIFSNFF